MVTLIPALRRWRVVMALALVLTGSYWTELTLAQTTGSEYQVKAAFLYQFATYVEWPAGAFGSASAPIEFAVVAAPELADNLEEIARSRRIGDRAIRVRRLTTEDAYDNIHVLFVGLASEPVMQQALAAVTDKPVLTVTEFDGERLAGSVINFEIIDERVRFDVAVALAQRRELEISARLLSVAQRIVE